MKAFIPIDITDERFVSSTIPEFDDLEPEHNMSTTYTEFAQVSVIQLDSHLVYESLVNNNLGNAVTDTTKWILKGKTNRHRMFDWNQGNPSIGKSPMTVVIRPGKRIDALMLDGLKAAVLEVTIRNGIDGPVAFTLDGYLLERNATSFYEYFYAPFIQIKKVATFAIPPIGDPVIYLTLSDPSGSVELSRFATGLSTNLGTIQWNPVSDSDNYSEIEWDEFGKATLTPVPSIPLSEQKLTVDRVRVNAVRQFREQANAKPVVWSGLDDLDYEYTEMLILFGVYRNFSIDVSNPNHVVANLSLKGI